MGGEYRSAHLGNPLGIFEGPCNIGDVRIVYLHGFASSPQSSKAQFFAQQFAAKQIPFTAPRLDGGDFEGLTITGQLRVIEAAIGDAAVENQPGPVVMMGSSLGGYLAASYASRHPEQLHVIGVIMLAPAFRFLERWQHRFTPEQMQYWRTQGSLPFYHYGSKSQQALSYRFIEDAGAYPPEPRFSQPGLILQGTNDPLVPATGARQYAAANPNITLKLFESGHELTDVLQPMWEEVTAFLQLLYN